MNRTVAADSDARMIVASKLAYMNLYPSKNLTVGDQLNQIITMYENYPGQLDAYQQAQYSNALSALELMDSFGVKDCQRWKICETYNDNDSTGFYGCMFDTRDGDAVLAFRGSEGGIQNALSDPTAYHDWVEADFGLLNSTETMQQQRAREFTEYIYQQYGDRYNYDFAGHSLGGNLATHAAVTAPDAMNIHRGLSIDGPGFSQEYLAAHQYDIRRRSGVIDHYQGTVVGALLTPIPGSNYQSIETTENGGYFSRHALENIVQSLDENGQARKSSMDPLATLAKAESVGVDGGRPLLLSQFCPTLVAIWSTVEMVRTGSIAFEAAAKELIKGVGTTIDNIRQGLENWYRNLFGASLTGEYILYSGVVIELSKQSLSAARKIGKIRDQVAVIAASLHFNSLVGSVYRSKLRSHRNTLSRSVAKAMALSNAADDCIRFCSEADRSSSDLYCRL